MADEGLVEIGFELTHDRLGTGHRHQAFHAALLRAPNSERTGEIPDAVMAVSFPNVWNVEQIERAIIAATRSTRNGEREALI